MQAVLQKSVEISGQQTEVLIQSYLDRVLVLVTQLGKVGNLIQASIPQTSPLPPVPKSDPNEPNASPLPEPPASIQLTPLFGSASSEHVRTLHSLYASQIATIVWTTEAEQALDAPSRRTVIVGIALKKGSDDGNSALSGNERAVFHGVMNVIRDMLSRK